MKDRVINLGIIGLGRAGMIHATNFATYVKHARVIASSDTNEKNLIENSQKLGIEKIYPDFKDLLKDENIDAIVIASPPVSHKEIAIEAALAGKHIFCEKPMAMNPDECEEIIVSAASNKVNLQIGFMRRFDKSFVEAKQRILQGEIGEVVSVKSLTHGPSTPQPWQYDITINNGTLAEVNSHDIDTLRWFTDSEFKEVYAVAGNFRCREVKENFPDFYDNLILTATFQNGTMGMIDGAAAVQYGYDSRVEILGTTGVMFVGSLENNTIVTCNATAGINRSIVKSWRDLFKDAYLNEDKEFIQSIMEGRPPTVTGIEGKKAAEVVHAGNQSIQLKKPIQLN